MNDTILKLENITTHGSPKVSIHENLNLEIKQGRFVSIIGASGSGKTTLLKTILLLHPIISGKIYLQDLIIDKNSSIDDAKVANGLSKLGMMFQLGALFSNLTVLENVMFPLLEHTKFTKETIANLSKLRLKTTGLKSEALHKYPKEISPGMQKKVALARALVLETKLLLLDEPTAGLDPVSTHEFNILLKNLQKQLGLTVIMISHDLGTIEFLSDEIVYLGNKHVLFHGSLHDAKNSELIELKNFFK